MKKESSKRLEVVSVEVLARDRYEALVRFIGVQFAKALNSFINQLVTQIVNCFCRGLENAYTKTQLSSLRALMPISAVRATSVKLQDFMPRGGVVWYCQYKHVDDFSTQTVSISH